MIVYKQWQEWNDGKIIRDIRGYYLFGVEWLPIYARVLYFHGTKP